MRVYLDSNVLIDICDGRAPRLATAIARAIDANVHSFPFTAEQVNEITFGGTAERNLERLEYLARLSRDEYFVHSVFEHGFRTASPHFVYATLNEVILDPELERNLANIVSYEDQRSARTVLGLESSELNNLCPRDAIRCIDKALASYEHAPSEDGAAPRSLEDLLSYGERNTKEHFTDLWTQMGANPEHMLLSHKIVSLFSLFDSAGFWPDSRVVYERGFKVLGQQARI